MHPATARPRARVCLIMLSLLLLGLTGPAWPRDDAESRASLKGIPGIRVVVEGFTTDVELAGLTKDQLQTAVEARLRQAGIKVTSSAAETEGFLYLNVNTFKDSSGLLYPYNIRLEFNQPVIVVRNRNVSLLAPTWSVAKIGIMGADWLRDVRDEVADLVDRFIIAYLDQNPKP